MNGTRAAAWILALALSCSLAARAQDKKPTVAIKPFDVTPQSNDDLRDRLPAAIERKLMQLGRVTPKIITAVDEQIFGQVIRNTVVVSDFTITGTVELEANNKIKIVVELEQRSTPTTPAVIKNWETRRENDPRMVDWVKRVADRIHERITNTALPKSVFVHCFHTVNDAKLKEYRWQLPDELTKTINDRRLASVKAVSTFEAAELHTACANFEPALGGMALEGLKRVDKYDYVLGGGRISQSGGSLEIPIDIRSTVEPESTWRLGPIRERPDLRSVARTVTERLRIHWESGGTP